MLKQYEGILFNLHLDACTREQLQAAHPGRFFPCPDVPSTAAHGNSKGHQQQGDQTQQNFTVSSPAAAATPHSAATAAGAGAHAHDASASPQDPEAIAGLQQGTAAWHKARSCHITGSQLADLLGFSCPAANKVLCKHQVYHRVSGTHAGHSKLLHCIGNLRRDKHSSTAAATAAPVMELFGQLACEWGTQHEAAAHHTLLQHSPPGSLLIDTGFVTPAFEADAAFYSSILTASPATTAIGSLGDISVHSVRDLRLGCSLDGLLLTPRPSSGTWTAQNSSSGVISGVGSISSSSIGNTHVGTGTAHKNSSGVSSGVGGISSSSGGTHVGTGTVHKSSSGVSSGVCGISSSIGSAHVGIGQTHGTGPGVQAVHPSSIRRAPPYSWARQAGYEVSCVEVKCPTPFWSVKDKPWAFARVGQDRNRPYQRMRAGHYCQSQLSMLVTGTECCVYVVWTSGRTWVTHVPINRAWLHSCLHILLQLQQRYVDPGSFTPPPSSLFWESSQLQDNDTQLSGLYRRFVEATAVLAAGICSKELPDPMYRVPWGVRAAQQQQQHQQHNGQQESAQQQEAAGGVLQGLGHLHLQSAGVTDAAAAGAAAGAAGAEPAPAPPPISIPPPGWEVDSSGRPAAHWVLLESPAAAAASEPADKETQAVDVTDESFEQQQAAAAVAGTTADGAAAGLSAGASSTSRSNTNTGCASGLGWTGVYSCMVKSLVLPAKLQQRLQQDRWFLDYLDPDSTWQQQQLSVQQAWLTHPLINSLCGHPQGVLVLLQRLHMSLPSLHLWSAAAAAGRNGGTATGGSAAGSSAGGAAAMRGLSPGKLVLALLFKTEQLNCLDLSPIWSLLPPSALEALQLWRTAAQRRATATAAAAAPSANAADTTWLGVQTTTSLGTTAQAPAATVASAGGGAVHFDSSVVDEYMAGGAAMPEPAAAGTDMHPQPHPDDSSSGSSIGGDSSKGGSSTEALEGGLPWVTAFQSWRQRQHLRQQQLVATLRRCISSATDQRLRLATRQVQHVGLGSARTQARQQPQQPQQQQAGVRKHTGRPVGQGLRRVRNSGSSGSSGDSGGSSKLAGSIRRLGLADLLQARTDSDVSAAAAAAAATASATELPTMPPRGFTPFGVPVAATAAGIPGPEVEVGSADSRDRLSQQPSPSVEQQQQQLQQPQQPPHGSASNVPAVPAAAPAAAPMRTRQVARMQRSSVPRRQQQARRLVSAAQQQQRAARLARYQEAVKTWSLADMMDEVRNVQVVQQPLQQPIHEVLQGILATQQQASELQQQAAAEEQQRRRKAPAGRLQPAKRQPVVAAAAAVAAGGAGCVLTPAPQQAGVREQQGQGQQLQQEQEQQQQQQGQVQQSGQQHAAAPKQKPQKKPRQAKAAPLRPPAAACKPHPQPQQQPGLCTHPIDTYSQGGDVVLMPATGIDVAAAAAAAAAAIEGAGDMSREGEACKLAAFTVVGPAAVLASMAAQQN